MYRYVYNFDDHGMAINLRFVDSSYELKAGELEGTGDDLPPIASLSRQTKPAPTA